MHANISANTKSRPPPPGPSIQWSINGEGGKPVDKINILTSSYEDKNMSKGILPKLFHLNKVFLIDIQGGPKKVYDLI